MHVYEINEMHSGKRRHSGDNLRKGSWLFNKTISPHSIDSCNATTTIISTYIVAIRFCIITSLYTCTQFVCVQSTVRQLKLHLLETIFLCLNTDRLHLSGRIVSFLEFIAQFYVLNESLRFRCRIL